LSALALLPDGADIVSSPPLEGVDRLTQLPQFEAWPFAAGRLTLHVPEPIGWQYVIGILTGTQARVVDPHTEAAKLKPFTSSESASGTDLGKTLTIELPLGKNLIANGSFQNGAWQRTVGNCNNQGVIPSGLDAAVLNDGPSGQPTLRLSATADSACEAQAIATQDGTLFVHFTARHLSGAAPRVCIFEVGPNHCAPAKQSVRGTEWLDYSLYVAPEAGTKSLIVYVYSDGNPNDVRTVNEYLDFSAYTFPSSQVFLIGRADVPAVNHQLIVLHESFSPDWIGPTSSKHVLVDGMTNGWLVGSVARPPSIAYGPAQAVAVANWVSSVTVIVLALVLLSFLNRRRLLRRRASSPK
jgi:hypothetical protein